MQIHQTREAWLNAFADAMSPTFESLHVPLPEKIRIAIAFTSGGTRGKRIGECWSDKASADGTFEIMIRPDHQNEFAICETVLHELIHAAVGLECGHSGKFLAIATIFGFQRPVRSGGLDEAGKAKLQPILEALGAMPHARLDFSRITKKKQATAMIKCECQQCGYIVRTTQKWLDIGAPHCNNLSHGQMVVHSNSEPGE